MSKGVTVKTPLNAGLVSHMILKRNSKGEILEFWTWEENVHDRALLLYPEICQELTTAPPFETEEATRLRRLDGIPQLPLENDKSKVLGQIAYDIVMALAPAGRPRALELAIENMQIGRRNDNVLIEAVNLDRRLVYENRTTRDLAKIVDRPKLSAWLLSDECLSPDALVEVKSDGLFVATGMTAADVMEIIRRVLGGVSSSNVRLKQDFFTQLRALRQNNSPTHVYSTKFKHALRKCISTGTNVSEADLIELYIFGLNMSVFEIWMNAYNVDPTGPGAPTSLAAAMNEALLYQQRVVAVNPSLAKHIDNSGKAFIAYSAEESDDTTVAETVSTTGKTTGSGVSSITTGSSVASDVSVKQPCQICGKLNHSAAMCFKLTDPAFIKQATDNLDKGGYTRRTKNKGANNATTTSPPTSTGGPGSSVSAVSTPWIPDDTCEIEISEDSSYSVSSVISGPFATADFEHDDHAQVSVVSEAYLWMFESIKSCNDEIVGVVPGVVVKVLQRGLLKYDMGRAVVVSGAPRLLASAPEIRKKYDMSCIGGSSIKYTHKTTKAVLLFRLDPTRFGDDYFHSLIDFSPVVSAMSLDFYNPPALLPVLPFDQARVWPLVHRVEQFHWATNHMSKDDMTRLVSSPEYYGTVTVEGIDLYYAHRGCSACSQGKMRAHTQLNSSRGLSSIVGRVAQGDCFFIESEGPKTPVLFLICEASLLIYMHVFGDAAARSRGNRVMINASELEQAIDGAIRMWSNAGHTLSSIRFDRESAITSSTVREMLLSKGVSLDLTAAGQKLGLAESMGGVVKRRCAATFAGISERYGYSYPVKWYIKLVGDTVSVLNRTVRKGSTVSPTVKFFGPTNELDVRRDLRASIGEVLLFKRPKRGVATDISVLKAEWGIVISRPFNGTGVLEVYLIESKAYGHRFKFERLPVPHFTMQLLRSLSPAAGPIITEPLDEILPNVLAPADNVVPPLVDDDSNDPDIADIDDVEYSCDEICSAQISYRKALLTSPARAAVAMEAEIQMLFGTKKLGRPIKLADIPMENRKFILRSLDGYKEKFSPSGEWLKSKARVFGDGSVQLPEFTAESSSPVARMETIFCLAGIAAYKGWSIIRFDVVCGYPNTPRPSEVQYRYLKLNSQIAGVVVKLFPTYGNFVDSRGELIIDLDFLIYGMKESGFYFYLLMLQMFHRGGFVTNSVDPCMLHHFHECGWEAHNAMTVDDCAVAISSVAGRDYLMGMFTDRFGADGFTYVEGNKIDLLGMLFEFDRENKRVIISQRKLVDDLLAKAGVTKYCKNPCGSNLFDVPIDSPMHADPDMYRSLNQSLAYLASRTYPECLPAACVHASRFPPTEEDFLRLTNSISYLGSDPDHCLIIQPGSLSLVCSADASYGVHWDGKSHSGLCVGFRGTDSVPDAFFMFSSGKQSIVTTSSCEAELVCANKGASYLVWASQLLEGFHLLGPAAVLERNEETSTYAHEVLDLPVLHQDNNSTRHLIEKGRGNFQNSKHIRVRYYFIRDLVINRELHVIWKSTVDMVADILSKGASSAVFNYLLPKLIGKR